jgi:hypothetical protein
VRGTGAAFWNFALKQETQICPPRHLIEFVTSTDFPMNEQLVFIGACFLFLSLFPVLYQLNIFGFFLVMTILSPMVILVPGFLRAVLNYILSQQCLPATVDSAHVELKWNKGLEATMVANNFHISNPVPNRSCSAYMYQQQKRMTNE